ncbi:PREDICTED: probable myosin-binding protein 5 [Camelina sativa]|uniref:Probable myosin-binding protein 5 n=1 Tax=Camelina sativa TaxID=90675 RepID=A0ABM0XDP3_CAMSA|nr:PREDICTED: probable myosin-binding protein 5 [Camelina sativa]
MPCLYTHDWNFTGLVGAFLNLSIAYLLLCTSLCIHLLLRFLGFLGLPLPRFHNGRFCDANIMRKCLHEGLLVDCASEKISAVDRSIKSKIPFGSITSDDDSNKFVELKLVRKNSGDVSNARVKADETEDLSREEQNVQMNNNKELGRFDLMTVQGLKGKRFVTRRSRNSLKNHRRGRVSCASLTSISSPEAPFDDPTLKSHLTTKPYDVFLRAKDDDRKGFISHWPKLEKTESINEQVNCNVSSAEQSFFRNAEENSVRVLEESLKEERAARAAVCVELDKERSAAASAADEAMAMIHRLQDEKAAVEMEARQFQRMVEEKSTFDAEEMVILKDILIRREREKHFLEKEVEAYRHLLVETEDALECSLTRDNNLTTAKTVKQEHRQHQDSQERRALLVQELDGTVLDMPYREEAENRDKNRDLYKSDSEVAYSRVRDVYMVKDETENIINKKKNLEDSSVSKPKESSEENSTMIVSGIARKLPPLCRPRKKSLSSSGSRRKSMSAVDYERLKIENEVELLRERLKAVQEERAELTRRASLPSLSSKVRVTSEKRGNWRRSSMDL